MLIDNPDRLIDGFARRVGQLRLSERKGYVTEVIVNTVRAVLPDVVQGELCEIHTQEGQTVLAEVIAFNAQVTTLSCLQTASGIAQGALVVPLGKPHCIKAGRAAALDVLDGFGRSIERPQDRTRGVLSADDDALAVMRASTPATQRAPISERLETGVRVVDQVLTLGKGQRVGLFAPPGCGKSTTMAQIARGVDADILVFGLVGERGRELNEFLEKEISDDLRQRSVFVCATSDRTPMERVRCAFTATSIAEHYRDQGKSVLLLIDSITRLARAQRELGLMAGEPTTQSGFTPSVYTVMPELIERAGRSPRGDITAIYTVLMEGDRIEDDPIASEAKSLLDGHIVLTPKLAEKGHFPAIDPLRSLSRVATSLMDRHALNNAACLRQAYSVHKEVELLIRLNEYKPGSDPVVDEAVRIKPMLDEWCRQDRYEAIEFSRSAIELGQLVERFARVAQ